MTLINRMAANVRKIELKEKGTGMHLTHRPRDHFMKTKLEVKGSINYKLKKWTPMRQHCVLLNILASELNMLVHKKM